MNQYRVSDVARSDLDEIWTYIAQDNLEAADKFIHAIVSRFPKLAAMPEMGRRREELSPRLRSFPVGVISSFIVHWKKESKSCACCMEPGICLHCLINQQSIDLINRMDNCPAAASLLPIL